MLTVEEQEELINVAKRIAAVGHSSLGDCQTVDRLDAIMHPPSPEKLYDRAVVVYDRSFNPRPYRLKIGKYCIKSDIDDESTILETDAARINRAIDAALADAEAHATAKMDGRMRGAQEVVKYYQKEIKQLKQQLAERPDEAAIRAAERERLAKLFDHTNSTVAYQIRHSRPTPPPTPTAADLPRDYETGEPLSGITPAVAAEPCDHKRLDRYGDCCSCGKEIIYPTKTIGIPMTDEPLNEWKKHRDAHMTPAVGIWTPKLKEPECLESTLQFIEKHLTKRRCDNAAVSYCVRCNAIYLSMRMREMLKQFYNLTPTPVQSKTFWHNPKDAGVI